MEFCKRPDRHEGICPVCNMLYVKELPEDRQMHRVFHRSVVDVFEPKPSVTLTKMHMLYGQFVPVRWDDLRPLRRRLANMARVFRREFGCDFTMYSETGDPGDGYLISKPDGRAIGGFVVRWIEYSNAPAQWTLSWIWIEPTHRRRGLMQSAWLSTNEEWTFLVRFLERSLR